MADDKKTAFSSTENKKANTPKALSDESRVKVMSPSMLVFKRFVRNKLAVIGIVILIIMFLFSFVGPIFTPYTEAQQFQYDEEAFATFAEFKISNSFSFYNEENAQIDVVSQNLAASTLLAMTTDFVQLPMSPTSTAQYYGVKLKDGVFEMVSLEPVATYNRSATDDTFTRTSEVAVDDNLYNWMVGQVRLAQTGMQSYTHLAEDGFTYVSDSYIIIETPNTDVASNPGVRSVVTLSKSKVECVATTLVFHDAAQGNEAQITPAEKSGLVKLYAGVSTMPVGAYTTDPVNANGEMLIKKNGETYALISNYIINPKNAGEFIPLDLKQAIAQEGVKLAAEFKEEGTVLFGQTEDGSDIEYHLKLNKEVYGQNVLPSYHVEKESYVRKFLLSDAPSKEHMLGTDVNGMDVMTRLMYGGRVSLMVGFVVVIIELVIGVILGGVAGYFSGWVDVIIMRFIELFNCIPFYPMMMIIGSVLDAYNISNKARIYLLMVLLGVLGWTGIARIVRGQILSLREQDFIVATEACGIPVSRRIFRHLIPNVIPLLIVNATMQLGGIIITEATLSFLGLGVRYPSASWGAMINQVQDAYSMGHYPWIWIPAGILILATVLGFNFVGDGLRDAFDPKMKR